MISSFLGKYKIADHVLSCDVCDSYGILFAAAALFAVGIWLIWHND